MTNFTDFLKQLGISQEEYLKRAKSKARAENYDPNYIEFSTDDKHKLSYKGVKFGSSTNGDYIIYSILAKKGKYSREEIDKKRNSYLARAKPTMLRMNDEGSPSSLSYYILWTCTIIALFF